MTQTITYQRWTTYSGMELAMKTVECSECHPPSMVPARFDTDMRQSGKTFWCPQGHSQVYGGGKSELDRTKERLRIAERSEKFYRDQAAQERRRAAAARGQRTRVLNLIAKGICPVAGCRRNFQAQIATTLAEHAAYGLKQGRALCRCGATADMIASGLWLARHQADALAPILRAAQAAALREAADVWGADPAETWLLARADRIEVGGDQ